MTEKEVKEWLNRAYKIDEDIEEERKEIQRLDEVKESVSGIDTTKPNVQSSSPKSAGFENRVIRIDEIQQSIKDRIVEKEEILRVCEDVGINGICTIASDVAAPTVAYVAEKMGLVGNSYEASVKANNKYYISRTLKYKTSWLE